MMSEKDEHRAMAARLRFLAAKATERGNMAAAKLLADDARREDELVDGAPASQPIVSSLTRGDKAFIVGGLVLSLLMLVAIWVLR